MDETNWRDIRNWERQTRSRGTAAIILESALFIVIALLALVGNAFVCFAVYRNKSLRSITHMYILSLSIADLLFAVGFLPLSIGSSMTGTWPYGNVMCAVQGSAILVWSGFTLVIVSFTAFNRYIRVVKPNLYKTFFSSRATCLSIAIALMCCFSLVGLTHGLGGQFKFGPHLFCVPRYSTKELQMSIFLPAFGLFIVIPMVIIPLCYWKVFRKVRHHSLLVAPALTRSTLNKTRQARGLKQGIEEVKITNVVLAVLIVFFVLWTPICIIGTLFAIGVYLQRWAHLLYDYLIFANVAANPVLYGLFNKAFRQEFKRIVGCVLRKRTVIENTGSTVQKVEEGAV